MTLLIIDAPHFNAGLVEDAAGIVRRTAPILAYMRGWKHHQVASYCARKAWQLTMRNEDLPAGAPMTFACVDCSTPITVPEGYVLKPSRCTQCGGEWSQQL